MLYQMIKICVTSFKLYTTWLVNELHVSCRHNCAMRCQVYSTHNSSGGHSSDVSNIPDDGTPRLANMKCEAMTYGAS